MTSTPISIRAAYVPPVDMISTPFCDSAVARPDRLVLSDTEMRARRIFVMDDDADDLAATAAAAAAVGDGDAADASGSDGDAAEAEGGDDDWVALDDVALRSVMRTGATVE